MNSGMWAPPDPDRKPEFHTIWQDIKLLMSATMRGAGWALVSVFGWILMWPVAAAALWLVGKGDRVLDGFMVVGYVWVFTFALAAWIVVLIVNLLRHVPIWAWLMIIPLFGIWRHLASINNRAREIQDDKD